MMSDFMFPIYLATNKNQKNREETPQIQKKAQPREAHGRPRQNKREAKLKHSNLQISKGLYIIIWYCKYKD